MDYMRRILDDPGNCLRLGILSGVIGISFIAMGLFGPSKLTYLRFVSIVFFIVAYGLLRVYFRNRAAARRNRTEQTVEQAPATVQFQQQPVTDQSQIQQPLPYPSSYPPAGATYGMQNQPNIGNVNTNQTSTAHDPSLPPPYPAFTWPGGQQVNNADLPPPPSYDEVVRGSR